MNGSPCGKCKWQEEALYSSRSGNEEREDWHHSLVLGAQQKNSRRVGGSRQHLFITSWMSDVCGVENGLVGSQVLLLLMAH